ncbi:MAG TPA: ABC transporter permease [Vicinamibacterales bacterium]|jgi:simple sugar transport system permease protein|nr:ABC transporter permease [Vicinamibacterales bacterium]
MRSILTLSLVFSTIRLATPLVWAAIGGLYSERSGVINIALEGLMLAGAFTAAAVTFYTHSPWAGVGAAMLAAAFFALLLAVVCIRFKANEVVAGTGINILFLGLPAVLSGALFLSSGSTPQIPQDELLPTLSQVVRIGPQWRVLTDVSIVSFLALLVVGLTSYVLHWTPFGLRLRSVGENPEAADAAGIRVNRIRYAGVVLSGVLAGVGGAYLSIGQSSLFTRNMTAGRGFIALAALIFGKWRPVQTMLACVLFGFADALTIQMQGVVKLPSGEDVPVQFIQMIPYVVTIVVLAGFIGQSRAPGALGVPYDKES